MDARRRKCNERTIGLGGAGRRAWPAARRSAQQINVKIGVLSDMSSLYADIGGPGSVAAAKLAVADFTKDHPNVKVEIVSADHQNKAGRRLQHRQPVVRRRARRHDRRRAEFRRRARDQRDRRDKNKVFIGSGPASSDLTGPKCNANTVHWTYDTWMLANGTGKAIVKTGGDTWFFLTSDYAFGHALERDTAAAVEANGGKVLGKVRHPLNTSDFSSFLLQAQASKAKIIGLANAGGDTINSIKQGAEFGIVQGGQKFAGLLVFASDVNALGLQTAQGLTLTETWYWDLQRRQPRLDQALAGRAQCRRQVPDHGAGRRLFGRAALSEGGRGAEERAPTARRWSPKMKEAADRRPAVRQGHDPRRRPQDPSDAYLFEVKKPAESKHPGDFYKLRATIPADGSVPSAEGRRLPAGEAADDADLSRMQCGTQCAAAIR